MVYMMHHIRPAKAASRLAKLAFVTVNPQHISTEAAPLACDIKGMHITC